MALAAADTGDFGSSISIGMPLLSARGGGGGGTSNKGGKGKEQAWSQDLSRPLRATRARHLRSGPGCVRWGLLRAAAAGAPRGKARTTRKRRSRVIARIVRHAEEPARKPKVHDLHRVEVIFHLQEEVLELRATRGQAASVSVDLGSQSVGASGKSGGRRLPNRRIGRGRTRLWLPMHARSFRGEPQAVSAARA